MIPVILLQIQIGNIAKVIKIAVVGQSGNVIGAYDRRVVVVGAGHVVRVDRVVADAASVGRIEFYDVVIDDIDIIGFFHICVAAVDRGLSRRSVVAFRLKVVPCVVPADEDVELAGNVAHFFCGGQIGAVFDRGSDVLARFGNIGPGGVVLTAAGCETRAEGQTDKQNDKCFFHGSISSCNL